MPIVPTTAQGYYRNLRKLLESGPVEPLVKAEVEKVLRELQPNIDAEIAAGVPVEQPRRGRPPPSPSLAELNERLLKAGDERTMWTTISERDPHPAWKKKKEDAIAKYEEIQGEIDRKIKLNADSAAALAAAVAAADAARRSKNILYLTSRLQRRLGVAPLPTVVAPQPAESTKGGSKKRKTRKRQTRSRRNY
jgi:hypothetical protein